MQNYLKLRDQLILETKRKIHDSVADDILIIQAVAHIADLTKAINILTKDLREWYGYYNPEFSREVFDHGTFVHLILKHKDTKKPGSMGGNLREEQLVPLRSIASQIESLHALKAQQENYIETAMKKSCPNVSAVAGGILGAQLLKQAGSLRRLALMPSSTIQLLGAEDALFRHLKTKAKCPKYGLIHAHPLIAQKPSRDAGKIARAVASKISIAARVDFMKGKFIGDQFRKELEEKFG